MESSIKEAHEQFVTGHGGSKPLDVLLAVLPVVPGVFSALFLTKLSAKRCEFFIQYCCIGLPLILSFTMFNSMPLVVLLWTTCAAYKGYQKFFANNNQLLGQSYYPVHYRPFITLAKSTINIATIISILAVDFNCFPRRFAKTETYGYSLMDLGVGCYVFMHGLLDTKRKSISQSAIKGTLILILLGILRFMAVRASNYQHHVTEYGLHANFFFVLALIKIMCMNLARVITVQSGLIVSCYIAMFHYYSLHRLEEWTLSDAPRNSFIWANREFFVSFPGYLTIYTLGATSGQFFFQERIVGRREIIESVCAVICNALLVFTLDSCGWRPSRRLANHTFVLWTSFFMMFFLVCFQITEKFIESLTGHQLPNIVLLDSVNRHPLVFFLLGNILTGLINLSINTLTISFPIDLIIINVYLYVCLYVVKVL